MNFHFRLVNGMVGGQELLTLTGTWKHLYRGEVVGKAISLLTSLCHASQLHKGHKNADLLCGRLDKHESAKE